MIRAALTITTVLFAAAGLASAAPSSGTVEGEVALPPNGVEEPPAQLLGYVERIKNPIADVRSFDPRPECFVYLDGGPAADDAKKPPERPVVLELGSASFLVQILPVVAGTTVDIKNVGKTTHALFVPDGGKLFEGPPVGPGGIRSGTIATAEKAVKLLAADTPHVEGRIVAMATRYFSRIGRDGRFKIEGVSPGRWTVRIWYRDGWLPTTQTVQVGGTTATVKLTLPERMDPKPPSPPGDGAPPPDGK